MKKFYGLKFKAKIEGIKQLLTVQKLVWNYPQNEFIYIKVFRPEEEEQIQFFNKYSIEELLSCTGFKDGYNQYESYEDSLIYEGDIVLLMKKDTVDSVAVVENKWGGYFVNDELMSDALERGIEFSIEGNIHETPNVLEKWEATLGG